MEPNLLKIDKNSNKIIDIYYIGYITIKKNCINHARGYIEEKNANKYLIFESVDESKRVFKKYADVWDGIKNKIKAINERNKNDYRKDYTKIKFNSYDDLQLNKPLKFHLMTIILRSVFEEDGKLYPQRFLDHTLYEL